MISSDHGEKTVKVAVVGAGISGVSCARHLENRCEVTLFEKSRGLGGRMASRRQDGLQFDHGAQYFTVRTAPFQQRLESWVSGGSAELWNARFCSMSEKGISEKAALQRYVGLPKMNAVVRALASDTRLILNTRVAQMTRRDTLWHLYSENGTALGTFDFVVLALPAPQVVPLAEESDAITRTASQIEMEPCWALMLQFPAPLKIDFDAAFVEDPVISWIARNDSKPGRNDQNSWIVHGSPGWSRRNIEAERQEVAEQLTRRLEELMPCSIEAPRIQIAHRWRYAKTVNTLNTYCLFDRKLNLGACGDWCLTPRVEGAYLSGQAISEIILDQLKESKS